METGLTQILVDRISAGPSEATIDEDLYRPNPQPVVSVAGLLAEGLHLFGSAPSDLNAGARESLSVLAINRLPLFVAARRYTCLSHARDAKLEQVLKVLYEARAGLLSCRTRDKPAHDVLALPDDAVQFAPPIFLEDATIRIRAVLGDPREIERQAVDHRAVPTRSG